MKITKLLATAAGLAALTACGGGETNTAENMDANMTDMNAGMDANMDMNATDMNAMNADMNAGMNADMNAGANADMNAGMNADMNATNTTTNTM
jgi:hypothetical protein